MVDMHEDAAIALDQAAAVANIAAAIVTQWEAAEPLSYADLQLRFSSRSLIAGWRLPAERIQSPSDLILVLTDLFPYDLPKVALRDAPSLAQYPHVEGDGVFCLATSGSLMMLPADIRHAVFVVNDAITMLTAGIGGINEDDFIEEAETYWTLGIVHAIPIWLLSRNLNSSRMLSAAVLQDATVIADSNSALKSWLSGFRPNLTTIEFQSAVLLALPYPLLPSRYPAHTGDLYALAESIGGDALDLLSVDLAPKKQAAVVLTFEHENKHVLLGLRTDIGTKTDLTAKGALPLWHGYRPERIPRDLLLKRIADAQFPLARTPVKRVDGDSLLARTTGQAAQPLATCRVAIIGCGALGGLVALLLAQAGIKRLTLVDPDTLTWQNVGRHILPGRFVGINKANAIRSDLLTRFPDYQIKALTMRWQDAWKTNPDVFDQHDIVLAMSAEWPSDALLNLLSKTSDDVPPTIFGWTEAFGLAGHAVTVLPDGGCLRCMTNEIGDFQYKVSVVQAEQALQREASCGTFFQPFSAASTAPIASMLVKAALDAIFGKTSQSEHRVWIGAKDGFDAVDAAISPIWFDSLQSDGYERIVHNVLQRHAECPVCKGAA